MKKRSLAWVLALVFFLSSSLISLASAEQFSPADDQQAHQWAIDAMMSSVFKAVYSDSTTDCLVRWASPIQVFLAGEYTPEDLATTKGFIAELNERITELPDMSLAASADSANMIITFAKLDDLAGFHDRSYQEGDWASFSYLFENYEIRSANILIASDVTTQDERNYQILKKMTGSLGLVLPIKSFSDSIITDNWTGLQELSRLDWLMLNLLYEPRLYPGITGEEARTLLTDGSTAATPPKRSPAGESATIGMNPIELTLEELSQYNGKNGQPAYIALDGIIYDVSNAIQWKNGEHHGFEAGNELTQEMKFVSPHGLSKLEDVIAVGKLVTE